MQPLEEFQLPRNLAWQLPGRQQQSESISSPLAPTGLREGFDTWWAVSFLGGRRETKNYGDVFSNREKIKNALQVWVLQEHSTEGNEGREVAAPLFVPCMGAWSQLTHDYL